MLWEWDMYDSNNKQLSIMQRNLNKYSPQKYQILILTACFAGKSNPGTGVDGKHLIPRELWPIYHHLKCHKNQNYHHFATETM